MRSEYGHCSNARPIVSLHSARYYLLDELEILVFLVPFLTIKKKFRNQLRLPSSMPAASLVYLCDIVEVSIISVTAVVLGCV